MIKLKFLIIIIPLLILGCKNKETYYKYPSQRIDNFSLNKYSKDGNKVYSIKSPSSNLDIGNDVINLKETTIYLFNKDIPEYVINSQESKLTNSNKVIELKGNVNLNSLVEEDNNLIADKFIWHINNSEYELNGNVRFENNKFIISSEKAFLKKENNVIEFFNPVNYIVKDNNNNNRFEVNSENAFYNIKNNSLSFSSKDKPVRSKIYF